MAITQRSEIITAIENWLATTAHSTRSAEFFVAGEQMINRQLRIRAMEAHLDIPLRARLEATAATGGSANAQTMSTGTSLSTALLGHRFTFEAGFTNTAGTTLAVDSITATNIFKFIGGTASALEANDLVAGSSYEVVYDGTRYLLCPRGGYPLPSRFLAMRRVYIDGDPTNALDFVPSEDFWHRYMSAQVNEPEAYTIEGDFIVFGPTPDARYSAKLLYHRAFAAMTDDTDTNWLVSNAGLLYVFAALIEAAPYLGADDRAPVWAAKYESLLEDVMRADKRDRFPQGGGLQQRSLRPAY